MRRLLLLALPLAAAFSAHAQTRRATDPLAVAPTAQGEVALNNGDYVLLSLGTVRYTGEDQSGQGLAAVAYEHFWTPNWSWGGRVLANWSTGAGRGGLLTPEVLLRHRSAVGPLTFGQRLSAERRIEVGVVTSGGSGSSNDQNWGRLRFDLEKIIPLGGADAATGPALRPRLAFEAATHLRLQKADTDPSERFIQYTSLRAEAGVRTSARFDFTPWFAYGTDYLVTLPQRDSKGNQTAGGNLNAVRPTLGLDVRFTFGPGRDKAGRQPLPTQH